MCAQAIPVTSEMILSHYTAQKETAVLLLESPAPELVDDLAKPILGNLPGFSFPPRLPFSQLHIQVTETLSKLQAEETGLRTSVEKLNEAEFSIPFHSPLRFQIDVQRVQMNIQISLLSKRRTQLLTRYQASGNAHNEAQKSLAICNFAIPMIQITSFPHHLLLLTIQYLL